MAKSFMMGGMQAGFDMTTQEGLKCISYGLIATQQLLGNRDENSPPLSKLGKTWIVYHPAVSLHWLAKARSLNPKSNLKTKGFGSMDDSGANGSKKKEV